MSIAVAVVVGFGTAVALVFLAAIVGAYNEHENRHRRGEACAICETRAWR